MYVEVDDATLYALRAGALKDGSDNSQYSDAVDTVIDAAGTKQDGVHTTVEYGHELLVG